MKRMLLAEFAVLIEFQPIRIVLLVLVGLIITALAFRAGQRNRIAHFFCTPFALGIKLFKMSLV